MTASTDLGPDLFHMTQKCDALVLEKPRTSDAHDFPPMAEVAARVRGHELLQRRARQPRLRRGRARRHRVAAVQLVELAGGGRDARVAVLHMNLG